MPQQNSHCAAAVAVAAAAAVVAAWYLEEEALDFLGVGLNSSSTTLPVK